MAKDKNIRRKKIRRMMHDSRDRRVDQRHEDIRRARRQKYPWLFDEDDLENE